MDPEQKLRELGIELPVAPRPIASYVPFLRVGNVAYLSGQIPMRDGKLMGTGKLGREIDVPRGAELARQCALQALSLLKQELGGLDRIERILKLTCFVSSAEGFTDQPKVANGASDVLIEILGEAGRHARTAVGVSELPVGAPVEIDFIVAVQ